MVIEYAPLEDELGDVLDKAMRHQGISEFTLASAAQIHAERIRDAIDYRGDFSSEELQRLARALSLNEVGLQALAQGRYPQPEISGLPFCLYPLRTPHGIGVANAYVVAECGSDTGVLFDAGLDYAQIRRVWPRPLVHLDAIFITHVEQEHVGGLEALRKDYPAVPVFGPKAISTTPTQATALGEGATLTYGRFQIQVLHTPGHAEAHNSYLVSVPSLPSGAAVLVSGDLLFAGSIGGAYHCCRQLSESLRRLTIELPDSTVIAPGHGPLTTVSNERQFNPFLL